jgi:hypothetical protein
MWVARGLLRSPAARPHCPNKKGQKMHRVETERGNRCSRGFARSRLFGAGLLANEGQRLNCLIRNISPGGAQIRLNASQLVPDFCFLINLQSGSAHRAYPVWRKGSLSGLRLAEVYAIAALPAHLGYLAPNRP